MKSILLSLLFASTLSLAALQAQPMASDNKMARPLGQVLDRVEQQFGVRFKYNVDTTGLVLNYADSRIRPYSLEETLRNILSVFDFKAWDQGKGVYKIKPYEYPRRFDEDGEKMVNYLNTL